MPTPPNSEEDLQAAVEAMKEHGRVYLAARALDLHPSTFKHRLNKAREQGLHLSVGARRDVALSGMSGIEVGGGWHHEYDDDGRKVATLHWRAPEQSLTDDFLDRVRSAFDGIRPAEAVRPPGTVSSDLLTQYPLFDVHFGMHAWGRETGADDYDTGLAADDIRTSLSRLLPLAPPSEDAIILIGGDFFHADDNSAATPASRHKLDVDGRHFKVIEEGVSILAEVCERVLVKHQNVTVRVMRGNHDEHSHMVLTFALAERYRNEPRINVEKDPRDLFMHQWGSCMIAAHHGDKAKPQDLVMLLADVCPFWSASGFRYVFTGHFHHDRSRDLGGVQWESLRPFCPSDAWAAPRYGSKRALEAMTFHKKFGRVLRATDPVMRDAA